MARSPKKKKVAAPSRVTYQDLHLLAHTARIQVVLDGNPDHGRADEYEASLAAYRARWSQFTPAERQEVLTAARAIGDMTKQRLAAAVAALEG